jgi:hypothetical protein
VSKRRFTPFERFAVYTTHGEKCYLCSVPLVLKTMEVDHVIPESLLDEPERLASVLKSLGRPETFDVNSFANWMPSCGPCNLKKLSIVFEPSLLMQIALQHAADKAAKAEATAKQIVSQKKKDEALNTLHRAKESGDLDDATRAAMEEIFTMQEAREPDLVGKPMRLLPLYEVLSTEGGVQIVRGPYGIGGGPAGQVSSQYTCWCGSKYFNGARCVLCGDMSDD